MWEQRRIPLRGPDTVGYVAGSDQQGEIEAFWTMGQQRDRAAAAQVPNPHDQIAFLSSLIGTGARRDPATCGTGQGNEKRRFDPIPSSQTLTIIFRETGFGTVPVLCAAVWSHGWLKVSEGVQTINPELRCHARHFESHQKSIF